MALIKCSECGKKISDKSTVCIHCGCPIENAAIESAEANEKIAVDTENSETAKKAVDKVKLKKIAIIASSVVGAIAIVATLLLFLVLKPAYEEATVVYNDAIAIYNETVATYEAKSTQIATENQRLTTVIDELQGNVSSGEKPYDPNTIPAANTAINEGKIALIDIPKWEDKGVKAAADYNVFQASTMKKDAEKVKAYSVELTGVIESMQVPDHTEVIAVVNKAKEALQFSIQQMKQVTCPSESFVLERVTNIRDQAGMIDVIALTEDNDPENYIGKAGWYTAKIIFRHKDVEHYGLESGLLSLNEVGNPAGGCIEVYRTEEDAQRRADELKSQEGTARSPGARVICGTMVIRVSDDLKTSYQQELLTLITNEMLRIEQSEQSSQGETTQEEKPSQGEQTKPNENVSTETKPSSGDTTISKDNNDTVETTTPNKNQQAVAEVEALKDLDESPAEIKARLVNWGGFSNAEAEYGIQHANIDWSRSAIMKLEYFVSRADQNNVITKKDCKNYLSTEHGYESDVVQYALQNAYVDWASLVSNFVMNTNDKWVEYTWCSSCEEVYGIHENCPFCNGNVSIYSTNGYTKGEIVSKLKSEGFSDSEITEGMQFYADEYFYDESKYKKP